MVGRTRQLKNLIKMHAVNQSPLYKIYSLVRLAKILGVSEHDLHTIAQTRNYKLKIVTNSRQAQVPTGKLKEMHQKIGRYLSQIIIPDYVFSKKGRSAIDNAMQHRGNIPVGKTDLSGFFPSVSEEKIKKMFQSVFKCPKEVSIVLASFCSYNGHLPTGSHISGYVAFFCAKAMFDELEKITNSKSIRMTVFVDDITFSGEEVTPKFLRTIQLVISRHGFVSKNKKTKYYGCTDTKKITGVILKRDEAFVPNSLHKKSYQTYKLAQKNKDKSLMRSYQGQKIHQEQILKRNRDN